MCRSRRELSLFLNLLFETDSYSNEYLLAKFRLDTAENEPCTRPHPLANRWRWQPRFRRSRAEARQAGRLPQGWLGELKRRAVLRDLILLRHVLMTEMRDVHEKFVAMLFCATYIINVHKLGR